MGKGSQTSTTSPNPIAAADYQSLLGQAAGVANTPYQAYTGQLVAPVNSQQTAGINNINASAGFASPYISQAAGLATGAANPLSASQIQNYQNPYTQDVVNATQAQFNNTNSQQQAALTGNNIAQGALGGNRTGVASANLANQQQLAQAPVIAGLENQGYTQALQTAAQQYQQNPLAAAGSIANFGIGGQNAALQGANAQVGAGTLQQQTQQALDTANYGQYAQAQAYPFQTTQWLAGLEGAIAPGLGSSTTGPAPNQTAQYLGAGLGIGALALSDRRAKQNIHKIGSTNDGQPLYRYQYRGSDQWHIGPIAQEVEKRHPEAVHAGLGGLKYVDLKEATDDSVSHRATGGPVAGLAIGGTPWSFAQGWVPQFSGVGSTAPHSVSAPSSPQSPNTNWSQLGNTKANPNGILGGGGLSQFDPSNPFLVSGAENPFATSPDANMSAIDSSMDTLDDNAGGAFFGPGFARGGVAGYADGGDPIDMQDRFAPVIDAIKSGAFDPQFQNSTDFKGTPGMAASNAGIVPIPAPRPADAPVVAADDSDDETSAVPVAGVAAPAALTRPTVAPATPFARDDANAGFGTSTDNSSGIGLGLLSKNAQLGLLAAGLGMLSSRSPFLGNAIGEGGLGGLQAYSAANAADEKAAQDKIKQAQDNRRIEMEATRLQQEAQRAADDFALRAQTAQETQRHNRFAENEPPKGYRETKTGLEAIPGGPNDPATVSALAKAKATSASMDDSTASFLADRVLAGDTRALTGLGRGAQGAENLAKINGIVAQKAASGQPVSDAARAILSNAAQQAGFVAAERTQAQIMAKLSVYGRTAYNAMDMAERMSDDVPRSQFVPVNRAINAWKTNTGDPKIVALGQAIETLTNEYARAIGGGHGTVTDKEHARERLNAAQTPEQLRAVIGTMRQEILLAEHAMPAARQQIRDIYNPTSAGPSTTIEGPKVAPGTPPVAAQPKTVKQNGYTYQLGADGQYHAVQP